MLLSVFKSRDVSGLAIASARRGVAVEVWRPAPKGFSEAGKDRRHAGVPDAKLKPFNQLQDNTPALRAIRAPIGYSCRGSTRGIW